MHWSSVIVRRWVFASKSWKATKKTKLKQKVLWWMISGWQATKTVIAMARLQKWTDEQERLTDLLWSCGWGCWKERDCPNTNGLWTREEGGFAAWSKMEGAGRLGRDWMEFSMALSWSPAVAKQSKLQPVIFQKVVNEVYSKVNIAKTCTHLSSCN